MPDVVLDIDGSFSSLSHQSPGSECTSSAHQRRYPCVPDMLGGQRNNCTAKSSVRCIDIRCRYRSLVKRWKLRARDQKKRGQKCPGPAQYAFHESPRLDMASASLLMFCLAGLIGVTSMFTSR